jgi:hypothetical protein
MNDLAVMIDSSVGNPGDVRAPMTPVAADEEAHGEMAFLVKLMGEMGQGIAREASEYQSAVLNLGIDTVLLPASLTRADRLAESEAKLQTAQRLLAKYDQSYRTYIEAARAKVKQAPFEPALRDHIAESFEEGLAISVPMTERMLSYERAMLEEMAAVVEFASDRQGRVETRAGNILFETDVEAAEYNDSIARIQGIAARQAELQQQMVEMSRGSAARLRQLAADPTSPGQPRKAPPRPLSARMSIVLGDDGPALDGWRIPFGQDVTAFAARLGKPDRTLEHEHGVMLIWDSLGLFASAESAIGPVTEFGILQFPQDNLPEFPSRPFAGSVTMGDASIGEVDTPRSLNRRLGTAGFEQFSDSPLWTAAFSGHRVAMMIGDHGLCDYLWILPPEPPETTAPAITRGPRF